MPARKRARAELEDEDDTPAPAVQPPSTLQRVRNMWEFASLLQYLFLFGKAIKAEEWDIEVPHQAFSIPWSHHADLFNHVGLRGRNSEA